MRVSEPSQIAAIELHLFRRDGKRVVLRVRRVDRDLCPLDRDLWCIVRADSEQDGKLTATSDGMDGKGCITGGDEDRTLGSEPGRAEFGTSFELGQDSDDLRKVTLGRVSIARASHDDSKLDLEAEHERPNQLANELLI